MCMVFTLAEGRTRTMNSLHHGADHVRGHGNWGPSHFLESGREPDPIRRTFIAMDADLFIARALTRRYLIALLLVALLATLAWISLHLVISEQTSTAVIVNISGRQRMLSQRTALFSTLLVQAGTPWERAAVRSKLNEAVDLMQRSHLGLIRGDVSLGLPDHHSEAVEALYFSGTDAVDRQVRDYLSSLRQWLALPEDQLRAEHPLLRRIVETSTSSLLPALDRMVTQYQREGETSIRRLTTAETAVWVATLGLLLLEAIFIFRPFVLRTRGVLGRLQQTSDALFESRERWRIVSENANDCLWKSDAQGVLREFESQFHEGLEPAHILGRELSDLVVVEGGEDLSDTLLAADVDGLNVFAAMAERRPFRNLEIRMRTRTEVWVRASGVPLKDSRGEFQGYVGIWTDITRHKQLEAELRQHKEHLEELVHSRTRDLEGKRRQLVESEERFRLISNFASDAIILIDMEACITYWNPAAKRMFGYKAGEVIGRNLHELLVPANSRAAIEAEFAKLVGSTLEQEGRRTMEMLALRSSGEEFPIELSASALSHRGRWHAIVIVRDISERKKAEEQIRRLAYYDTLTHLPNRRLLLDRLEHALTQSCRHGYAMALMFIDLDGFKLINDTLGHDVGDELLQEVALRLTSAVRAGDTVSRHGGDEFVVILEQIDTPRDSAKVAEKLITCLQQPIQVRQHALCVTASIGITLYQGRPEDAFAEAVTANDLMKQADMAMYDAKQNGRNQFCYFGA